jgi:hypothetical protein
MMTGKIHATILAIGLLSLTSTVARAQVNVTTWHNDLARTGANTQETILTPANVNVNDFGKLFSTPVDGQVYAQPLYLSNVSIGGGTHNVVYIATQHDSVYAIDADSGTIYAHVSLIPSGGTTANSISDLNCADITPEVGITGTPVIDPANNILYVVSTAKVNGNILVQLHALNTISLAEEFNGPVEIAASVPGTAPDGNGTTVVFNPVMQNQRAGLALTNGHVVIGFGSHCDNPPYHGWLMSYGASSLVQEAVWNSTPDSLGPGNAQSPQGGIWMAGAAPPVDANGDIYVTSGNGYWSGTRDFSDTVLKLGPPANNAFPLLDWFTPFDQGGPGDSDVGSAGPILFPTPSSGAQLLGQQGKQGTIYLVNRSNLGHDCANLSSPCTSKDTEIPEELRGSTSGVLSSPVYWNGNVYWQSFANLFAWSVDPGSGLISPSPTSQTGPFALTASISLSANATSDGILWMMQNTAELFAFDATNLANVLWTSFQAPGFRDEIDSAVKFEPPTIVNGKVYYGTNDEFVAWGLLGGTTPPPPTTTATPTLFPQSGTYTGSQSVSIADTTSGAAIYYTTNGTMPSTSSTAYTGPITVSGSETIEALAVASGLTNSAVGSATYTIQEATTGTPTFSPAAGTYTATQSVKIADTTSGATIYYTTNGTTPPSTLYTGPISVSASETLQAIAVASGQAVSAEATAAYTISPSGGGGGSVSYPTGFTSATGFTLDGGATVTGGALQLTDGGTFEARAIWYSTPLNIQQFTTDFTFQITPASANTADGMTFAIQNQGLTALGGIGGALGYQPVTPSVAVKFDLYNNAGEGVDSVGFYTNGAAPTVPAIDLTSSGVNLHSGDVMHAHLTYDGTTLTLTLTDTVTNATFTAAQAINIPATVLANTAIVGFTGGTGGNVSTQNILSWTYTPTASTAPPPATTATPTLTPASGTYTGSQSVSIADTTSGAAIYYTTNGTMPSTSSTAYTGPITVSGSETIEALAVASGLTNSAVGSATYTIQEATTGTPTFSPAAGTYTATQSVKIADTTSGATIYYTTNGTTPPSTLYTGPISVSASETLQAIAVASGQAVSAEATAAYTISPSGGGGGSVSYPTGFTSATGFTLDGGATVTGGALQLTDGGTFEARAIWYSTPLNIQQFTTDFTFQITPASANTADGMTFAIQNQGLTALGGIGGALGYQPVTPSVAVKFDLYNNAGEGVDSVGFYTNGAAPTVPAIDLTSSGVNLHSGDVMHAHLTYDGTTLTLTLTDTVTNATFTAAQAINIPATVLANTAIVGFTGGTGGNVSTQNILSWTYTPTASTAPPPATTATPTLTPASGTYTGSQSVSIADTTSGAAIYYTTNGTMPSTSSTAYTGPITVSGSETIEALAVASGLTNSAVGSATYTIQEATTGTPTFSPAAGTYTATQSVKIADTTSGATIYYTTNGTTPPSTLYTGPISVSASETLQAIAVASGQAVSAEATAAYTISPSGGGGGSVSYPTGFTSATGFTLDGGATVTGGALQLTDGGTFEARAIWYSTPLNIQQFTTDFTFQITPASANTADGMTFAIQNQGLTALGGIGGALGYQPVTPSVAVKFDLYNNAGEGVDSVGFYTNGAAPTVPAIDLTSSGVNLHSGDVMHAHLTYDGTTLTLTLTDTVTNATFTAAQAINIPATVLANTAIVGFTGGTGGNVSTQNILSWTYTPTASTAPPPATTATPTLTPASGTYTGSQSVSIADTTSGAAIYYTTNGTMPSTSSTAYTGPITVSGSETIEALAVASGLTNSAVGSATYTIQEATTGTPTFSPAAGTYTATQSVKIADTTSGATIYYTTNGTTPPSTLYTGPISVSASETLQAIAVASGQAVSAEATAAYTISPSGGGGGSVSYPTGFTSATGFTLDGGATVTGGALQLTDGGTFEARAIWYSTPLNIQQFTTDFTFQITPASANTADGMTFAIQNQGLTALGGIGGALGYQPVTPSVAVKFDLYNNAGEGVDSVGFYTNGAAPTVPAIDLTSSGVNLHSGDVMHAHLTYDGTTLTLTLTDTVTNATFTAAQAINIPATVLANTAIVGFTGGTGGNVSTQNILSWTYQVN